MASTQTQQARVIAAQTEQPIVRNSYWLRS